MIVLDTNVVSELMRPVPAQAVAEWIVRQNPQVLFTTSITLAEILYGLALLPEGRRRDRLMELTSHFFAQQLSDRLLSFDESSALEFAAIRSERHRVGRPIGPMDCQIAAIARAHGATLATRNTRDFTGCGIELVDPWQAGRT